MEVSERDMKPDLTTEFKQVVTESQVKAVPKWVLKSRMVNITGWGLEFPLMEQLGKKLKNHTLGQGRKGTRCHRSLEGFSAGFVLTVGR